MKAAIIKTAVMSYYRFRRQMVCCDEVACGPYISDVLVQSAHGFYDIEIKLTKADLWSGEAKKQKKHSFYSDPNVRGVPNYFILCVPTSLLEDANIWIDTVNPRYGILEFIESTWNSWYDSSSIFPRDVANLIQFIRHPKRLNDNNLTDLRKTLIYRLNSAYLTHRQRDLTKP